MKVNQAFISELALDARNFLIEYSLRENLSGSSEAAQNSASAKQIRDLSQRLINIIEEGQQSIPPQFIEMQDRIVATIEDLQIQLDVIVKYDWDFDHYLEEDVPAAVR